MLEIKKLLDTNNIEQARTRAVELDELAGGHIAYEEAELYPRLAELTKQAVSEKLLVNQHHQVLDGIRLLVGKAELSADDIAKARSAFDVGIGHAEHCGSLISLMTTLDKDEQDASLAELLRLRKAGTKWSKLSTND